MRSIFILILFMLPMALGSTAQEPVKGFELKLSLIHPERHRDNYDFSVDPTFEALYYTSISKSLLVSGGLMIQAGKHNWDEYTAHTIYPENWTPFPLRGIYDRRYEYICAGIPLKIEKLLKSSFFSTLYTEVTAGRYFQIELEDYYNSKHIYTFDIGYHGLFWDVQLGLIKNIYQKKKLSLAVSASAGVRNQQLDGYINRWNLTNYFYYGLGVNARLRK